MAENCISIDTAQEDILSEVSLITSFKMHRMYRSPINIKSSEKICQSFCTIVSNQRFKSSLENKIPITTRTVCKFAIRDFSFGVQPHCFLWIAVAEYRACCLSAMGVIWLSDAQWVRRTRQGHEEVKLLPLPRRRTCFQQRKAVVNKEQNMILADILAAFSYQHNSSHFPTFFLQSWRDKRSILSIVLISFVFCSVVSVQVVVLYCTYHHAWGIMNMSRSWRCALVESGIQKGGSDSKVWKPQDNNMLLCSVTLDSSTVSCLGLFLKICYVLVSFSYM